MSTANLQAVARRLEAAVLALSEQSHTPAEMYSLYEMVAIGILDSEHEDFPPGILEAYLLGYLAGLPLAPED